MTLDACMPPGLEAVPVPAAAGDLPVPHYVDAFIRDAEDRAEELGDRAGGGRFIPGDYRYAFQVLQWLLREKALAPGAAFLEWGSGQGMVAILAALLGYDACGVEIDAGLVKESRELAAATTCARASSMAATTNPRPAGRFSRPGSARRSTCIRGPARSRFSCGCSTRRRTRGHFC